MSEQQILVMYLGSITISLVVLWVTWKRIEIGRLLLVLLFLWASYVNSKTAITNPEDYLNYAAYAWSGWYRDFILGTFAANIKPMVLTIASGQFLIALFLSFRGIWVRAGAVGAIIFFLAIAPLGVASGFPTSIILAVAAYLIARHRFSKHLMGTIQSWLLKKKPA